MLPKLASNYMKLISTHTKNSKKILSFKEWHWWFYKWQFTFERELWLNLMQRQSSLCIWTQGVKLYLIKSAGSATYSSWPHSLEKTSTLTHCKDWCWNWRSTTLAIWCEEPIHWKRLQCWERLKAGAEGGNRGWDGWMASATQRAWVWASSWRWWRTGKPGVQSQTQLSNWTRTTQHITGLPWQVSGKNPSANTADAGSIPGSKNPLE